ncbi:Regulatory protein SoxS [Pontiella desulfatans]|uniref:Regulatory protein SoxS n=1 Tax=Pontiella desulfatans TaxID=2750659 RepID=A0A6C2UCZ5_PONDE|nr:AraC family transcriptional regulator [Pontiella desulfatans]VGO17723.1 Regulatory protein SoxS [Pontiella desulfatans]
MNRKNLQLTKSPVKANAADQLKKTGLAVEYFPAFEQKTHEFHTHNFVEMLFVINGTFRHVTADRTVDETAGGLTILNYNQFHTLKTPNGPVELMNVYWDLKKQPVPDLPDPLAARLQDLIPIHPMLGHRLNRIRRLHVPDPGRFTQILHLLHREQQASSQGSEAAIETLFRLVLIELCRIAPAGLNPPENEINPRMETVRLYLETHFAEPIRLDTLCELSNLRQANLCRQFKAYTGLSTGNYLKQRRLAAALQKLRTTSDKILTICHDCGFSDISNFNRTFRSAFSTPPSEYRRQNHPPV